MADDPKTALVEFLIQRAFHPVLKSKPDHYSAADREKLAHVQDATRAEIERFRSYGSAEEVVTNFKRDLSSQPAKRVHAELKALHLPMLGDFREEFERRAEALGVKG